MRSQEPQHYQQHLLAHRLHQLLRKAATCVPLMDVPAQAVLADCAVPAVLTLFASTSKRLPAMRHSKFSSMSSHRQPTHASQPGSFFCGPCRSAAGLHSQPLSSSHNPAYAPQMAMSPGFSLRYCSLRYMGTQCMCDAHARSF